MSEPLISIVLPCYNVQNYIKDCVESILLQTYKNIEIILVDDGSKDDTPDICDQLSNKDTRIKVYHKENGGVSDARNYGISKVTGTYFSFVDPDDLITPDYIEYLYSLLSLNNTNLSIAAHNIHKKKKATYKGIGQNCSKVLSAKETTKEILLDKQIDLSCWGKLYKSSLFDDIQFPKGIKFEDTYVTYKIIDKCENIAVGGKPVYTYQIRDESITTSINFNDKIQLIQNTKIMCDDILKKYPDLEPECQKRLIWAYFSTLNQLLKADNKNDFNKELNEITSFLINKKRIILGNTIYSTKEKIAIILLSMGLPFYNFARKIAF